MAVHTSDPNLPICLCFSRGCPHICSLRLGLYSCPAHRFIYTISEGFPGGSVVKNPSVMQKTQVMWVWSRAGVSKIRWKRPQQPAPAFLPGEPHGQRSLAGYSPQGHKESDKTEHAGMHTNLETKTSCGLPTPPKFWDSAATSKLGISLLTFHLLHCGAE